MIKFFRKIRQKLLTENHFSKYLIYAIGEILLVMIGILLALQVNNWNEERKRLNLQQFYLNDIIEELDQNLKVCNMILPNIDERLQRFETYFEVLNNEKSTDEELIRATDSVIRFLGITFFNTSVFDELNQSGDFKVFDPDLRKLITENYYELDNMVKTIDIALEQLYQLRSAWYTSIDYAHHIGLKDEPNSRLKNWKTDRNSEGFKKSHDFYAARYSMLLNAKRGIKRHIELTETLKETLKKYLKQ